MARTIIFVIDSLGIGFTPDAENFGDNGANTLFHVAKFCSSCSYRGPINIPNLCKMGLGNALFLSSGHKIQNFLKFTTHGGWAAAKEISIGKDTPSGHFEMIGMPITKKWGFFYKKNHDSCFPRDLLERIIKNAGLKGSLGNCVGSGTEMINLFGEEHKKTGQPIFYTSQDSVFQVACHENSFGLNKLYSLCEIIRNEVNSLKIARVIARPFYGDSIKGFKRTSNRRDYMAPIHGNTLFNNVIINGGKVILIGKIADIFPSNSISHSFKVYGTRNLFYESLYQLSNAPDNSVIMTNFVDFDQEFGHRRDVLGYSYELELFDNLLEKIFNLIKENDLFVVTADHGCDPTWHGSDHTREYVPQLIFGPNINAISYGIRKSFSDIGQTIANWMGVQSTQNGISYKNYKKF